MAALAAAAQLEVYAEKKYVPDYGKTFLSHAAFAELLGAADRRELEHERLLQQARHSEAKERDRLFNQLKRTRRDALRETIMRNEEQRQAALFALIMAEAAEAEPTPPEAAISRQIWHKASGR